MTRARAWIDAEGYLFDIDGTLLNASGRVHYNAFSSALEKVFSLRTTIDGIRWGGNTDRGILQEVLQRQGLSAMDLDHKLAEVIEVMSTEVERNRQQLQADVCPSIIQIVEALHRNGKLLGIASGNFSRIGWVKIEAAGLRPFFSFGRFADDFATRFEIVRSAISEMKRRLGKEATLCLIGDTPSDIQSAKANHIPVIAVATGPYSLQELRSFSPDLCLRCCDEALPLEIAATSTKIG